LSLYKRLDKHLSESKSRERRKSSIYEAPQEQKMSTRNSMLLLNHGLLIFSSSGQIVATMSTNQKPNRLEGHLSHCDMMCSASDVSDRPYEHDYETTHPLDAAVLPESPAGNESPLLFLLLGQINFLECFHWRQERAWLEERLVSSSYTRRSNIVQIIKGCQFGSLRCINTIVVPL
jgi:hypothetical protein